jgi:ADP-ribosylglycohydrolase
MLGVIVGDVIGSVFEQQTEAILAFLESESFEHAIRLAISLGGDSDTLAAMAGGIAQAFYREIPSPIVDEVLARLPAHFVEVIEAFESQFAVKR